MDQLSFLQEKIFCEGIVVMDNYSAQDLIDIALQSRHGIALHTENYSQSRKIRRKLYSLRDRARSLGKPDYDCLSFVVRYDTELLIVPRHNAGGTIHAEFIRPLESFEAPKEIKVRGKSKSL